MEYGVVPTSNIDSVSKKHAKQVLSAVPHTLYILYQSVFMTRNYSGAQVIMRAAQIGVGVSTNTRYACCNRKCCIFAYNFTVRNMKCVQLAPSFRGKLYCKL